MNCLENPIGDQMPKLCGNNLDMRFFEEKGLKSFASKMSNFG